MSKETNSEMPLSHVAPIYSIPRTFQIVVITIALALIIPSATYVVRYSLEPERFAPPAQLDLGVLIFGGAALILAVTAPWNTLGLIFRKLGPVEFESIVNTQAQEHVEELAELRTRIEELELRIRGLDGTTAISEHFSSIALYPLLEKFLRDHSPTAYSPLRIQTWGSRQPGFEELGKYRQSDIRGILQKMVANGSATTTVSRLGNTLYRAIR